MLFARPAAASIRLRLALPRPRPRIARAMSAYVAAPTSPAATSPNGTAPALRGPAAVAYDLRSDTVTVPTPAMLHAMVEAPVGDDVFREDPSINALEAHVASMLGKPAALFCSSGTLANQLAIRAHLSLGGGAPHSVLVDARAHVHCWEAGGIAAHCGAVTIPVDVAGAFARGERTEAYLTGDDVRGHAVRDDGDHHCAPTRLVCVENTCNGSVMPVAALTGVAAAARELGLPVHMDGARLWNAAVAANVEPRAFADHCDSVSVCLSKGIGAPVGSVLVGSERLIMRARHLRKMYGGGMRQAGVLAAAALHALDTVFPVEIARTHTLAARLAQALRDEGAAIVNVPNGEVHTNMVFVDWAPLGWAAKDVVAAFAREASGRVAPARVSGGDGSQMRLVVHYQIADDVVERFVRVVRELKAAAKSN